MPVYSKQPLSESVLGNPIKIHITRTPIDITELKNIKFKLIWLFAVNKGNEPAEVEIFFGDVIIFKQLLHERVTPFCGDMGLEIKESGTIYGIASKQDVIFITGYSVKVA